VSDVLFLVTRAAGETGWYTIASGAIAAATRLTARPPHRTVRAAFGSHLGWVTAKALVRPRRGVPRSSRRTSQLLVLRQRKAYQPVVAPFDGVVTRRNINVDSLVQADATSGTFMFTLTLSNVMRIRLYVPQDAAIGVKPGIDAVVRVPEIPDRLFRGRSRRSPTPWSRRPAPC
jgi:hypothetical protein